MSCYIPLPREVCCQSADGGLAWAWLGFVFHLDMIHNWHQSSAQIARNGFIFSEWQTKVWSSRRPEVCRKWLTKSVCQVQWMMRGRCFFTAWFWFPWPLRYIGLLLHMPVHRCMQDSFWFRRPKLISQTHRAERVKKAVVKVDQKLPESESMWKKKRKR